MQEAAHHEAEAAGGGERGELVARVSEAHYLAHLRARLENLHPADISCPSSTLESVSH